MAPCLLFNLGKRCWPGLGSACLVLGQGQGRGEEGKASICVPKGTGWRPRSSALTKTLP